MMNFRIFSYKTSHGPTRHKLSVLFSLTILWLAVLTGCNPDVFVRHIDPSQRDFTIKEDGDSLLIRFKSSDWRVTAVERKGQRYYHGIDASTSDGKMTLGDFTIHLRKNGGKELAVTFDPNFSDAENDVKIFIANNYEEDSVLVRQPASSGYDLEDLVWSEEVVRLNPLNEIEEAWGLCFKNLTPDTLWVENKVFEGAKRIITFTGDSGFGMHGGTLTFLCRTEP